MKNKNIDRQSKETCAQKSDQTSLWCDSTTSSAINFLFFIDFVTTQKKKIIFGENQKVKRKIFICEISIIILICQKFSQSGLYNKKLVGLTKHFFLFQKGQCWLYLV